MDGWMDGWVDVKAGLRIVCSIFTQKVDCSGWMDGWVVEMVINCVKYFELKSLLDGWKGGWMEGRESRVKDCLQQSISGWVVEMVISCVKYFELKSLLDGRKGGWVGGRKGKPG